MRARCTCAALFASTLYLISHTLSHITHSISYHTPSRDIVERGRVRVHGPVRWVGWAPSKHKRASSNEQAQRAYANEVGDYDRDQKGAQEEALTNNTMAKTVSWL